MYIFFRLYTLLLTLPLTPQVSDMKCTRCLQALMRALARLECALCSVQCTDLDPDKLNQVEICI